jgi:hypothetical protein
MSELEKKKHWLRLVVQLLFIAAVIVVLARILYANSQPATKDEIQKTAMESDCANMVLQTGRRVYLKDILKSSDDENLLDNKVWLYGDMRKISKFCATVQIIDEQGRTIDESKPVEGKDD